MIQAIFTENMTELLRSMKGKTFKSYEYLRDTPFPTAEGNLRINLGRFAIDLFCLFREVEYFGETEEMSILSCAKADLKSDFEPYLIGEARQYLVDEVVKGVEVVRDHVDYNEGECVIDMDVALVIRTNFNTYTFSRGIWFSETLDIAESKSPDEVVGVPSIEELWYDDEPGEEPLLVADVARSVIVL